MVPSLDLRVATTLAAPEASGSIGFSSATGSPSFEIRGAGGDPSTSLRLDRVNSRDLFALARGVFFRHLQSCPEGPEPVGVVLPLDTEDPGSGTRGRVVFALPVLLPEEQFIPLDLLLARSQRSGQGRRGRLQVPRSGRGV